ncbi:MAG: 3-methyladenine DNA glycosylase [Deltaproteobacteria bacterium RIFCSPLOWO2_12_FULL_40_28]|nr:MAG: 3-methyladenine DNA glycosylase [Deltaproteobacteria bacterium RIFCSPHIGHO2_02_FULL_40_28]OGQ19304.1 MAG: 3-methyladenine DNA glycosylase [Deltaproteobacteria bacterium RIFCSPHIGHO2_12_FULL_40_32]OGQ40472.1 MAG: 3-methyladenine DNA glycosylase [Deltaproteobacteria bacterium RIFCSPLOWO2_02_FULL_40_36]OGQ53708.1 MAG: 3-methyladenine DNA glycosylase [Deltaproteobacteria bacterium RIFCSPLOWO2_12_FULL_40_28]
MQKLKEKFFKQSTLQIAKNLLGATLIHDSPQGTTIGRIVETEAYLSNDPACHAARGKTSRNQVMFGPPGHAYIYFIYGMYFCFNVVTGKEGIGEAVLIRALEPIVGLELMKTRRPKIKKNEHLCNGPAKLVLAMGIEKKQNGICLQGGSLRLERSSKTNLKSPIVSTTRIGIKNGAHLPYRFYFKENPFISKK